MKLSEFLFCTALVTVNVMSVSAAPPFTEIDPESSDPWSAASASSEAAPRLPSPLLAQDKVLSEAYRNALSILSSENSCSAFFGGATGAVVVFNRLMSQVRKDYFGHSIGMRMSGAITSGYNLTTKTRYRMFDKMSLNANGPFYRQKVSPSEPTIPRLGSYPPNTKEVRVLILLHELGHLMKGDDGNWLLPDDGKAEAISHNNSQKIEDACGEQIKSLNRTSTK
jgi:hypothetical protein